MTKHHTVSILLRVFFLMGIIMGSMSRQINLPVQAAPAAVAAIHLNPSSGTPGTVITVNASGFIPGAGGEIRWDGATLVTFMISSGSFTQTFNVPMDASAGKHTVAVCGNCYGSEFVDMVTADFLVVIPPANTHTPGPIQIPTDTWIPVRVPTATIIPTPTEPPSVCGDLGLGPDTKVVDFEGFSAGQKLNTELEGEFGVSFDATLEVTIPGIVAHSGTYSGRSVDSNEFGSSGNPIRLHFSRPLQAFGMFVGQEEPVYAVEPVTAILSVFGYRGGSGDIVLLGSSAMQFPEAPTDIKHCLTFEAVAEDLITFATLEYSDSEGHSTFEPRLLDDLTLVYSTQTLPVDKPPVVTITSPGEGALITGGDISFTGEIREDRRLASVNYQIETSSGDAAGTIVASGPLGFSPAGGDPQLYFSLFTFSPGTYFTPNQTYVLVMTALDDAGQEGEARVTVYYVPPPPTPTPIPLDIRVVKIEITQAVQCMNNFSCEDNSVPLIQKKPTLVRAYLASNLGPVDNISGYLMIYEGDALEFHLAMPLAPVTVENVPNPVAAYRGDLSRTLNFLLPVQVIERPGWLHLRLVINLEHNPPECFYDNNEALKNIRIYQSDSLHIVFIPIATRGTVGNLEEGWKIIDWMSRVYPIYDIRFWRYRSGAPIDVEGDALVDGGCGYFWTDILNELWWLNLWTIDPEDYTRYYGLVDHTAPPPNYTGCGKTPGDEAAGVVETGDRITGKSAAHEIGHNHGLNHATSECGAANPDPRYPVARGHLDEFGVDILRMQVYNPFVAFDIMGYCGGENDTWISRYSYLRLFEAIGEIAQKTNVELASISIPTGLNEGNELFFMASGIARPNEVIVNNGFYQTSLPASTQDDMGDGNYTVELQAENGSVLFSRGFGPVRFGDAEPAEEGVLQLIVPWVEGTHAVVFKYGGNEIGRQTASPNSPNVKLISPNGGETWAAEGNETISWQASDPDGDLLSYTVQFSADRGQTWTALVTNTKSNKLAVDLENIQGSQNALVRIVATDGMNTAEDISDAIFSVAAKGPGVHIAFPEDGASYAQGQPLFFQGYGTDMEDGPIENPAAFWWNSDRDGILGQGDQMILSNLSPGKHLITLSTVDSSGNNGHQVISITIGKMAGLTDEQRSRFHNYLVILILAGIGMSAVIVIVGLGISRRQVQKKETPFRK